MEDSIVIVSSGLDNTTQVRIKQLVSRTLGRRSINFDMVVVKLDYVTVLPQVFTEFKCVLLVKHNNHTIIRSKAADDEIMLAVYSALTKAIDEISISVKI